MHITSLYNFLFSSKRGKRKVSVGAGAPGASTPVASGASTSAVPSRPSATAPRPPSPPPGLAARHCLQPSDWVELVVVFKEMGDSQKPRWKCWPRLDREIPLWDRKLPQLHSCRELFKESREETHYRTAWFHCEGCTNQSTGKRELQQRKADEETSSSSGAAPVALPQFLACSWKASKLTNGEKWTKANHTWTQASVGRVV